MKTRYFKRQPLGRPDTYLIVDTNQHRHHKISLRVFVEVSGERRPAAQLRNPVQEDLNLLLNFAGPLAIRASLVAMEFQYAEVVKIHTTEDPTYAEADVDVFLAEQLRVGGEYPSEKLPRPFLEHLLQTSIGLHLSMADCLSHRAHNWLSYYGSRVTDFQPDIKLTKELIGHMEAAENAWADFLRSSDKATGMLTELPADIEEAQKYELLVGIIDLAGHSAYLSEAELLDLGYCLSARRMIIPPGRYRVRGETVIALENAETGKPTDLSYMWSEKHHQGFVVVKPFAFLQAIMSGEDGASARQEATRDLAALACMDKHHQAVKQKAVTGDYPDISGTSTSAEKDEVGNGLAEHPVEEQAAGGSVPADPDYEQPEAPKP